MPRVRNNITRLLDQRGIAYTAYTLPAVKLSALETARYLGVPPMQVFKTLVVVRPAGGKPLLAVIPGPHRLDLKALARLVGVRKLKLASQREAERLTGLQVGGISPLALLGRGFAVWLDARARDFTAIHLSGGQRGLNIRLAVEDVVRLCRARLGLISHAPPVSAGAVAAETRG